MVRKAANPRRRFRPTLERLEQRDLFTVRVVTNLMDGVAVAGSLRAQIAASNDGDSVVFQGA